MRCHLNKIIWSVLAWIFSSAAAFASAGMKISCEKITLSLHHAGNGAVDLKIKNNTNKDIYWYNYFFSESSGLISDIFYIKSKVGTAEYTGVNVERLPPTTSSFSVLRAGQAYDICVDLVRFYKIDSSQDRLEVRAELEFFYILDTKNFNSETPLSFCSLRSDRLDVNLKRIEQSKGGEP